MNICIYMYIHVYVSIYIYIGIFKVYVRLVGARIRAMKCSEQVPTCLLKDMDRGARLLRLLLIVIVLFFVMVSQLLSVL